MPITNIIDMRKRPYRWRNVTAIVELTCQDNAVKDSDQADESTAWFGYDERKKCTVEEAIAWAAAKPGENTLFLYDLGDGIKEGR